jgi:hypothetical protein
MMKQWNDQTMTPTFESEIAEAAKRYVAYEWHLDVKTFGQTRERAWVRLAGRILDRPGATMPVKGLQIERRRN